MGKKGGDQAQLFEDLSRHLRNRVIRTGDWDLALRSCKVGVPESWKVTRQRDEIGALAAQG